MEDLRPGLALRTAHFGAVDDVAGAESWAPQARARHAPSRRAQTIPHRGVEASRVETVSRPLLRLRRDEAPRARGCYGFYREGFLDEYFYLSPDDAAPRRPNSQTYVPVSGRCRSAVRRLWPLIPGITTSVKLCGWDPEVADLDRPVAL